MSQPQSISHILELTVQQQKDFINSFDIIFSDCDGVVWLFGGKIPGSGRAINQLKAHGKRVIFVSNNSMDTDDKYTRRFASIGVENFKETDIMQPAKAMVAYIKKHKIQQPVFSVCSSAGNETLKNGGIQIRTIEPTPNMTIPELIELVQVKWKVGAVLFDVNLNLTYAQLAAAGQCLQQPDCALICGGTDRMIPIYSHLKGPGFVDFLELLSKTSQKDPIILGKPGKILNNILQEVYGVKDTTRCLFIGDSLTHDIRFGNASQFQTLLVLTGTSTKEEMWKASAEMRPNYYSDSLADFIQLFNNIENV